MKKKHNNTAPQNTPLRSLGVKYITTLVIIVAFQLAASAQPVPPTAPDGKKVPVGVAVSLLAAAGLGIGAYKLRRKSGD
ncbi:MAG: hypothetical protein K9H26_14595 [Prolixibacteraceae bacterium]|nr:hypothetical protein [Prolixibacteraceae bacterium]